MNLQLIGVNHRSAPVEIRERFAIPEKKLPEALQSLVQYPECRKGSLSRRATASRSSQD